MGLSPDYSIDPFEDARRQLSAPKVPEDGRFGWVPSTIGLVGCLVLLAKLVL